jgi:DNA-binding transcriptional ArsR family regulator
MNESKAALGLAALGHEARLRVFRLLVRAGPEGLNIGDIGRLLDIAPSTLAHHLGALVAAGLVAQEKRGRETINRAEFATMHGLVAYIEAECCAGVACATGDAA